MQIEEGKYYRNRNGEKIGPMRKVDNQDDWETGWSWTDEPNGEQWGRIWHDNGCYDFNFPSSPDDLICLWEETAANKAGAFLSSDTIDAIALDSLKWHFSQDMEPLQREAFRIVMAYYGAKL